MKQIIQKYALKAALLAGLLTLTAGGMALSAHMTKLRDPDAVQTVGSASAPVIVLDAGHGGIDGGCSTADGIPEKGINLSILLDLRDLLTFSGYEVHVTRDTDRSIHDSGVTGIANQKRSDMENRLAILNAPKDAVCISIHQNQFTDPQYSGAQMFYSAANPRSEALAGTLQSAFQTMLQPRNSREIKLCGKELYLCDQCRHPMVMAECGFLSNPEEAALLVTDEYQHKVAFTIYSAIQQWFAAGM